MSKSLSYCYKLKNSTEVSLTVLTSKNNSLFQILHTNVSYYATILHLKAIINKIPQCIVNLYNNTCKDHHTCGDQAE